MVRGVLIDISARKRAEEAARGLSGRLIHAREEERARLARELHDDLAQCLAVLAIEAAQAVAVATMPPDCNRLGEIHAGLVRLSSDMHDLSYRLHPTILEDLELAETLGAECDHIMRVELISILLVTEDMPEELPRDLALCLFRVAQVAKRNVVRHANATRVVVTLSAAHDRLHLEVRDNGRGFEVDKERKSSLGLASMRQRVELAGGEFAVESTPGRGTRVRARVYAGEMTDAATARAVG